MMTAIPLTLTDVGPRFDDPVSQINTRIERARTRLREGRQVKYTTGAVSPALAVFDDGQLIGAILDPRERPVFGPAAPTVLLARPGAGAATHG